MWLSVPQRRSEACVGGESEYVRDGDPLVRRTASRVGVAELRSLFRHLAELRSLYESKGVDEVVTPDGKHWSLWDLEYLYRESQKAENLTLRQSQAIHLCLIEGLSEREASKVIGTKPTNPVAIYANQGLARLLELQEAGRFARFQPLIDPEETRRRQRQAKLQHLAEQIRAATIVETTGCWVYPLSHPRINPVIALKASGAPQGFVYVHPLWVMYEALIGPIPSGRRVTHHDLLQYYYRGCSNPEHAILVEELR